MMTLRVKISHCEEESEWHLRVKNSYDNVEVVIRPGGSYDFLMHSAKDLIIREVLNEQKNGEPEKDSPS